MFVCATFFFFEGAVTLDIEDINQNVSDFIYINQWLLKVKRKNI